MSSLREKMQEKPWIGWVVASVLLVVAVALFFRGSFAEKGAYNPERMREFVTIRYSDTGDEEKLRRGAFEKRLRSESSGLLDLSKGLLNPKTQQATGFLVDTEGWSETVNRINAERKRLGTEAAENSRRRPDAPTQLPAGFPPATEQPPAPPAAPADPK
jgi:hypothetical protein